MSEFFVKRLGGNGHIDATGDGSNNKLSIRYTGLDSNGWCLCAFHDLKNELVMVTATSGKPAAACGKVILLLLRLDPLREA